MIKTEGSAAMLPEIIIAAIVVILVISLSLIFNPAIRKIIFKVNREGFSFEAEKASTTKNAKTNTSSKEKGGT